MRLAISAVLALVLSCTSAAAQEGKKGNVLVEVNDDGATSELLDTAIGAPAGLKSAHISLKYFGPNSDSDISVVLTVVGARPRYGDMDALGARVYAGDMALNRSKLRIVDRINQEGPKDFVILHLTNEELAWLAGESKVQIELYTIEGERKVASFVVLGPAMTEFNQFAKSVLLIKSHIN